MAADTIGVEMPWDEAVRLGAILRADPSSMLAAALEGWDHPISREALVLMDLFDLEHTVNTKKPPKPHPGRPWKDQGKKQRMGNVGRRTPEQVRELLTFDRTGAA